MQTLLVSPDHNASNATPWGVLSVGSYIRGVKGYDLSLLDGNVDGEAKTLKILQRKVPSLSLVGVSSFSTDAPFLKKVCDLIKETNPRCKIVVGGPHVILCPDQTARYPNIDYVAYSDGEVTFATLMEELQCDRPDLERVPGLIHKQGDRLVRTPVAPPVPFYPTDYTLLDERVLETFNGKINVLAGRGCPFKCTFCFTAISGQTWRGKSSDMLHQEVKDLVEVYDPREIYFRDELFFTDKNRVIKWIDFYKQNNFTFKWYTSARATDVREGYIDVEMLRNLADAGCSCLKFGFESGSDRVLKMIKKGINLKSINKVIETFKAVPEVEMNASFLTGLPGESYEEIVDTVVLSASIQRDVPNSRIVGPQYFRVYPGGSLYDSVVKEYDFQVPDKLEGWVEWFERPENSEGFFGRGITYPWLDKRSQFLASHADLFVEFMYSRGFRHKSNYKKQLLSILRPIIKWRLRHRKFRFLVDIRLAEKILEFSIWDFVNALPPYRFLNRFESFRAFKTSRLFRSVSGYFAR
ncbi:MAG: cobalamin-dependent protein [Magnetococcales bacterium]|nr:cobalamin-dependent protein [Magnetococcales bacterium]